MLFSQKRNDRSKSNTNYHYAGPRPQDRAIEKAERTDESVRAREKNTVLCYHLQIESAGIRLLLSPSSYRFVLTFSLIETNWGDGKFLNSGSENHLETSV